MGRHRHRPLFNIQDYLQLHDWTGRCVRDDKRGAVGLGTPILLATLGIAEDEWLPTVTTMQSRYEVVMGAPEKTNAHAQSRGGRFYGGYRHAVRLYQRCGLMVWWQIALLGVIFFRVSFYLLY